MVDLLSDRRLQTVAVKILTNVEFNANNDDWKSEDDSR